ncbi:hypothetical protein SAMN05421636_101261 [Pricia antarctica]|uniref:Uncharacterized protein n=1 Tax=Pricia antarctica TaxID=641691 RepID=A0A1G6WC28_9FLAO|nr:hypothetical protein [Pricia antarctica]SDD63378.1 hypothetical protein SAMN05421636_101261 [Pricia antarctica]
MKLKLLLFFVGWMTAGYVSPDLETVRQDYRKASENAEATKKLFEGLTEIGKNDNVVLVAYKGAVTTMMAEYAEGIKNKKSFFKEGRDLLEYAIKTEPENVEIRCIRLSVQENVPKITGYHKNKEADKAFILANYASMEEAGAKEFVKRYTSASDSFTEAERQRF